MADWRFREFVNKESYDVVQVNTLVTYNDDETVTVEADYMVNEEYVPEAVACALLASGLFWVKDE